MEEKKINALPGSDAVEAEVLDENGRPVREENQMHRQGQFYQARAGFFSGFAALAFSFIMILVMAAVTVFIVLPLMLLGRLLGMQVKSLRR